MRVVVCQRRLADWVKALSFSPHSLTTHCWLARHTQGYDFYIAILYIVASVLIVSLGLCVWVGWCFKNQRFTVVW